MSLFFSYIFLGLSLSAPIGPINAAQLDKGMKYGFLHAWLLGFGAMLADLLFMMVIYYGGANFFTLPFMKSLLWSFGCFVLIYTGVESLKSAGVLLEEHQTDKESPLKAFSSGFFMAISNPLNILFWFGIYGSVLAKTAELNHGRLSVFFHSTGIFVGIFLWDIAMALLASIFRNTINPSLLMFMSRTAGFILIGFGIYFGFHAYVQIFM
ncbi:LysE family transporter [Falsibacillus albus]|uniref:Amino acid transporter n=1 Tax=Falsibacillus albus TaxID=2478915 RepID=A0A3L7JWL5_9BACI|nr:LysE family transporter [Falsibacillus albus]RLQ94061.1 amino acid transporter [Falsibacillus albus]